MAPTSMVPNRSRRYAGTVAKPPPYMLRITQKVATNGTRLPARASEGRPSEPVPEPVPGAAAATADGAVASGVTEDVLT